MTKGYCVRISEGEDFERGTEIRRCRSRFACLNT